MHDGTRDRRRARMGRLKRLWRDRLTAWGVSPDRVPAFVGRYARSPRVCSCLACKRGEPFGDRREAATNGLESAEGA